MGTPGQSDTYPAGSTSTADPGEYLELGNVGAGNTRVIATVLLPKGVPLISDRSGSRSNASGPTDDFDAPALRPTTVHQSTSPQLRSSGRRALSSWCTCCSTWTQASGHHGTYMADRSW